MRLSFSLIEWIRALFCRKSSDDHSVVVKIYDNGHLVYRDERFSNSGDRIEIISAANTSTSLLLGSLRRDAKLAARMAKKGVRNA